MYSTSPLVSIITPAYNYAKYTPRLFESILAQTYDNIEFILVNDGSSDNQDEIIDKYWQRFKDRGYNFIYIKKNHEGTCAAINAGLAIFKGAYLCWIDADDWYAPESIRKRVAFMEAHHKYGDVVTDVREVKSDGSLGQLSVFKAHNHIEYFKQFVYHKKPFWNCLSHMLRAAFFLDHYPDRQINVNMFGQNLQMLLPMAYHHPIGVIHEELCYIYQHSDSDSRKNCSTEVKKKRATQYFRMIRHLVEKTVNDNLRLRDELLNWIDTNYSTMRLEGEHPYGTSTGEDILFVNSGAHQAAKRNSKNTIQQPRTVLPYNARRADTRGYCDWYSAYPAQRMR